MATNPGGGLGGAKEGARRALERRILEGWPDAGGAEAAHNAAEALTPEDERLCLEFCLDNPALLERALRGADIREIGGMSAIQAAIRGEIEEHLSMGIRAMAEDPWFLAQAMAAANERPEILETWFFRENNLAECWSRIEASEMRRGVAEGEGLPRGARRGL